MLSNTDLCDTVNGSCTCKQGWEGSSCEVNVDECTRSPNLCPDLHDHCVDSNGSFACVCDSGYISIGQTCVGELGLCNLCKFNFFMRNLFKFYFFMQTLLFKISLGFLNLNLFIYIKSVCFTYNVLQ